MKPSNTEFVIVRNPKGYYTDTLGVFKRKDTKKMKLDFIRTLKTNQGIMDEYELISEN